MRSCERAWNRVGVRLVFALGAVVMIATSAPYHGWSDTRQLTEELSSEGEGDEKLLLIRVSLPPELVGSVHQITASVAASASRPASDIVFQWLDPDAYGSPVGDAGASGEVITLPDIDAGAALDTGVGDAADATADAQLDAGLAPDAAHDSEAGDAAAVDAAMLVDAAARDAATRDAAASDAALRPDDAGASLPGADAAVIVYDAGPPGWPDTSYQDDFLSLYVRERSLFPSCRPNRVCELLFKLRVAASAPDPYSLNVSVGLTLTGQGKSPPQPLQYKATLEVLDEEP